MHDMRTEGEHRQVKFLLACTHTGDARSLADMREIMTCPVCDTRRKLLAIESREWHVSCEDCTFGRWCGSSEDLASSVAVRHRMGHRVHVDWTRHPDTVKQIKEIFGRTVRNVIVSDSDFRLSHKFDPVGVSKLLPKQGELDHEHPVPDSECPF